MSTSKEPREVNSIAALEGACGSGAPRMGDASNGTSSNTGIDRRTFLGAVTVVPLAAGLGFSRPFTPNNLHCRALPGSSEIDGVLGECGRPCSRLGGRRAGS